MLCAYLLACHMLPTALTRRLLELPLVGSGWACDELLEHTELKLDLNLYKSWSPSVAGTDKTSAYAKNSQEHSRCSRNKLDGLNSKILMFPIVLLLCLSAGLSPFLVF